MSYSNKVVKGVVWSSFEKMSVQIVQFIIGVILARILTPNEYGIIGILLVFIAFLQVFIDSGFTNALIQSQTRTEADFSTVFFFNAGISIFSYLILWVCSPYIANFYDNSQLIEYIRVLGVVLFFNALFAIPNTILIIDFNFRTLAKINFLATIVSGLIAVGMAYYGYGVWSLIWQLLLRSIIIVFIAWFLIKWRPVFIFSINSFKRLFSYGSKLLYSSLLGMIVNNFANLFIAKLLSTRELGYYTRGTQFTDVIYGTTSSVLDSVLLPAFSQVQNNITLLEVQFKTIIKSVSIILVPIFFLLAILAKPIILLLLSAKWLPVVTIMQIFCFARLISIISGVNVTILYAIGRSDLVLKQQVLKIFIRVSFLILALQYGIIFIAFAELVSTLIHFFINTYYPGKIIKISGIKQLKEIAPIVFSGAIMMSATYGLTFIIPDNLLVIRIIATTIVGITIYISMILLFKVKELSFLLDKAKEMIKK